MSKKILITGATDGIGYETAKMLNARGHHLLLHGRNPDKLNKLIEQLQATSSGSQLESYCADLSQPAEVEALAQSITNNHDQLDVIINNAGVFKIPKTTTAEGLDARFMVNTIAPYMLTKGLMPLLGKSSRVINLSSAAQMPVDLAALTGDEQLGDNAAYAQSKLALTMWTFQLASQLDSGPALIAVNPGSLLASKMVKAAYGIAGSDLKIGADILTRAALDDEFASASGQYYDNDARQFAPPHPDASDTQKCSQLVATIESIIANW